MMVKLSSLAAGSARRVFGLSLVATASAACSGGAKSVDHPVEQAAPVIDRFSDAAGHLMKRSKNPALPGPGKPIDFDRPPFLVQAFGPDGSIVRYYHFDVQPAEPATLYRLTRPDLREPIPDQLDIVDAVPGAEGYSDFWRIAWVEVPQAYVANSITSAAQIKLSGFSVIEEPRVIDCPVVPPGSTAREANGVPGAKPTKLWYRGAKLDCLQFGEPLAMEGGGVPTSPIYVTFTRNPDAPDGGPASGFRTEETAPRQTHNVVMSLPGDLDYSPLWDVHIYDQAAFDSVRDGATARAAKQLTRGPLVNCPVVARSEK